MNVKTSSGQHAKLARELRDSLHAILGDIADLLGLEQICASRLGRGLPGVERPGYRWPTSKDFAGPRKKSRNLAKGHIVGDGDDDIPTDTDSHWSEILDKVHFSLVSFWSNFDTAMRLLDSIPNSMREKLDSIGDHKAWIERLRRTLDEVSKWLYWTRPKAEVGYPEPDIGQFLTAVNKGPPENWEALGQSIEKFKDELYSLMPRSKANKSITKVSIRLGRDSFVISSEGLQNWVIPVDLCQLFKLFLANVIYGAAGEYVQFEFLNTVAKGTSRLPPEDRNKASDVLRKQIGRLNERFAKGLILPGRERAILARKSKGYYLNELVHWTVEDDELNSELARYSQSVFGVITDPATLRDNTPDRGQRLPAQSRRDKPLSESIGDE